MEILKSPKLRFPEFEEAWDFEKIGILGEVITGSTPPTNDKSFYEGEYLFVSPIDIQSNRYVEKTKTTLTKKGFLKGRKVRKGSTLFVCIGSTIGKLAQAKAECITNQQINSVVPINNNDDFVFSLLEFHADKIQMLSANQAVPILNKTTFSNYHLYIPSLSEQTKIASFLTAVDEKLQGLKKKKALLEQYKKGLMQQLFSRQLRFKDDNGQPFPDWEEKKLGEICTVKGGKRIPLGYTLENNNNGFPYITVSDMKNGSVALENIKYVPVGAVESIKNYKISVNDIFVSVAGTLGLVGIIPVELNNANLTENANKLTNLKCSQKFLYQFLLSNSFKKLIENVSTVGAQPKLAIYALNDFKVDLPSIAEQTKIANFLSAIDEKIKVVQQQIEKTERWKKGLLQQMFV